MQKVYVVVSGSYSDYGICSIHLDKEEAENAVKLANLRSSWIDDARIEEWDIGVNFTSIEHEAISKGMSFFDCYFTESEISAYPCDSDEITNYMKVCETKNSTLICVMARDEEHAIKISSDEFRSYFYEKKLKSKFVE